MVKARYCHKTEEGAWKRHPGPRVAQIISAQPLSRDISHMANPDGYLQGRQGTKSL